MDLLIMSYVAGGEGVSLKFNKKFSPNGGISTDEVWVSWDKIGSTLYPDKYSKEQDVRRLRDLRAK
jgi:hypothetical protein